MQRLGDSEVQLRTESSVGVGGLGIVRIQLTKNVESAFRHHLFHAATVVIAERKPRIVSRIAAVRVISPLVRVRKISVEERIHERVRHLRFLPGRLHADIHASPFGRGQCHFGVDVVAPIVVVDEHSVLIVETKRHIICALVRASACRQVMSL